MNKEICDLKHDPIHKKIIVKNILSNLYLNKLSIARNKKIIDHGSLLALTCKYINWGYQA